jgi:hypothetical protein
MNTRNISMVAILLVMVSVGVFASSNSDLKGSDFVRLGQLGIVSGTLSEEDGEWYLTTKDSEYALHLGNYEVIYPKGINLKEGSDVVVRGFVLDSDISAVTVATGDDKYSFRTAEGIPLWSGQGERQNQLTSQYERSGQGNYRQSFPVVQNRQASYQSLGMQGRQVSNQSQGQGMLAHQASYQNPVQGGQGRQADFQGSGQGRGVVQSGPKGRR